MEESRQEEDTAECGNKIMHFRDQSRITQNGASPKRLKVDVGTQVMHGRAH